MPEKPWAAALLVAAFILALLAHRAWTRIPSLAPSTGLPVVVDIQGDVRHPDRYALPGPTASLSDALRAAGGPRASGRESLPEAIIHRVVPTGTIVRVRGTEAGTHDFTLEPMPASTRLLLGIPLDVNEASLDELLSIPRMKPDAAKAIVELRRERPWRDLQELRSIPGIGPRTVEKWQSFLVVRSSP